MAKDSVKDAFKTLLSAEAVEYVKEYSKNLGDRVQKYLYNLEKKMLQVLVASAAMLLGMILLFISLPFLANQYLHISFGLSLFYAGVILMLIALIMKIVIKKEKVEF